MCKKKINLDNHDRSGDSYFKLIKLSFQPLYVPAMELPAVRILSIIAKDHLGNSSPRYRPIAIYLRHRVFLI